MFAKINHMSVIRLWIIIETHFFGTDIVSSKKCILYPNLARWDENEQYMFYIPPGAKMSRKDSGYFEKANNFSFYATQAPSCNGYRYDTCFGAVTVFLW